MTIHDSLVTLREQFRHPMDGATRAALLNAAALQHHDEGWGLIEPIDKLPMATRLDGTEIADGILFNKKSGETVQVFRDPHDTTSIAWTILEPGNKKHWIAPIPRKKADPHQPPAPPADDDDPRDMLAARAAANAAAVEHVATAIATLDAKVDEILALLKDGLHATGKLDKRGGKIDLTIEESKDK